MPGLQPPQTEARSPPSTHYQIHYSPTILPFDATQPLEDGLSNRGARTTTGKPAIVYMKRGLNKKNQNIKRIK
jgi:hypothetical protein